MLTASNTRWVCFGGPLELPATLEHVHVATVSVCTITACFPLGKPQPPILPAACFTNAHTAQTVKSADADCVAQQQALEEWMQQPAATALGNHE
jgi:hypothetical protein